MRDDLKSQESSIPTVEISTTLAIAGLHLTDGYLGHELEREGTLPDVEVTSDFQFGPA